MKPLLVFILTFTVALPTFAQTSATFQAQTTRTESSTSSAGAGSSASGAVTTESEEAAVDAYLKIKGVEGESQEKKGNVEVEWKVEEGESAAPGPGVEPDEIDVMGEVEQAFGVEREMKESGEKGGTEDINIGVGELKGNTVSVSAVEVRGWDPQQKQEFLATVKAHAQVQSGQDLENFAKGVLLENENMEEISLNFEEIKMRHRASGRLFGLIPVSFIETVEIDPATEEAGRIKVKFPWFAFFIVKDVSGEEIEAAIGANEKWMKGNNEDWDFGAQAEIIASISNALKTKHETAMNAIRNVK